MVNNSQEGKSKSLALQGFGPVACGMLAETQRREKMGRDDGF